jgi:hypothetical protein
MEQKLQVNQIIVSWDLASIDSKEVGFQIPLLSWCKKTIMF